MTSRRSCLVGATAVFALGLAPVAAHAAPVSPQKGIGSSAAPGGNPLAGAPAQGGWLGGADDCAMAQPIVGTGIFPFDTTAATTGVEGQLEPLCGQTGAIGIDVDVWFLWNAPNDGIAVLDTCDGQATIDTKVAIYAGASCPMDGTAIACNDDVCATQTAVAWQAQAGTDYLIQLGSFPGAAGGTGTFELELGATGGTLANYDAGTAGSPPVAPTPTSQGWTKLSGSPTSEGDVSPDGATGLNAWQVEDPANSLLLYESLVTNEALAASRMTGWTLEARLRVVSSAGNTIFFEYSTGTGTVDQRYHIWLDESGPDVMARVLGPNGATYTCPNAMDGNYHLFEVRKAPGQDVLDAEFFYDGNSLGVVTVTTGNGLATDGGVSWGCGNNGSVGTGNFNRVTFEIGGSVTGTPYCFGDGSSTQCPCGNSAASGEGCANSTGSGAVLDASGSNSFGADDLEFLGSNLLPNQPGLLFVGLNAVNSGNGVVFGDGLRCAGMGVIRLGVQLPDGAGNASWGPGLAGQGGWSAGDQRYFQIWYRNPNGGPCGTGFNLSNGFDVLFQI